MMSPGVFISHKPARNNGTCSTMKARAIAKATVRARTSSLITSGKSRLPKACEVIPLVPIRRKPNTQ